MEIRDKRAKIWRRDVESKNGTFYRYSVGVSKKNEDGSRASTYIPVVFSKRSGAPEKIENGATCEYEGFMSVESYKDKEGKTINRPIIIIMSVTFDDDSFTQMEEEIPF